MITSNTSGILASRAGGPVTTSTTPPNRCGSRRLSAGTLLEPGLWLGVAAFVVAGCASTPPVAQTAEQPRGQTYEQPRQSLVGPPGPAGAVGPAGARGETGETGAAGIALAGPRGATGPAGQPGQRGPTGATGAAGAVEVGQAGAAGATGAAGAQGERGATGRQGASAAGFAGETGLPGAAGIQGERGETGAQGATLVGPTGPVGARGAAGEQGAIGATGSQGDTTAGLAGVSGASGESGAQGAVGATGERGPTGLIAGWTSYRDFWFANGADGIRSSDTRKIAEIADYMKINPSLQLGIDTFADSGDQRLRDRRVEAVRDALVAAGIPAQRISAGSFGAEQPRRASRVEVLITTAPAYSAMQ